MLIGRLGSKTDVPYLDTDSNSSIVSSSRHLCHWRGTEYNRTVTYSAA